MRATLLLLFIYLTLGLFLWITLSGALLALGFLVLAVLLIITVGYPDTMVLYLLGAREVRSGDEKAFLEAASQEAYKLSVSLPRLYFYNGTLERAFILQNRRDLSLVLSKDLLDKSSPDELKAICFELLLQVKKGMANKRTKSMFLLGFFSWLLQSFVSLLLNVFPFHNVKRALLWFLSYLLHPFIIFVFHLILGKGYFKKLESYLNEFQEEKDLLRSVGLKLEEPYSYYSLPSRKILELSAVNKNLHFQSILALEFLPHEWDFLFKSVELNRAE